MRRPRRHTPSLPPWSEIECPWGCGAPVRDVEIGDSTDHVGMRPAPMNDRRADVATITMNGRLIGRVLTRNERPRPDENVWIRHREVCPNIQRPTQLDLLQEELP